MGFSKDWSSRLVYTGWGSEKSFLVASEATKLSFSADVELLSPPASPLLLAACDGFTSVGRHEEGCDRGASVCCNGALGATIFFLNSELAAAALWGTEHAAAGEETAGDAEDNVAGSDSGLPQACGSGTLDSGGRHCEADGVLWFTEDGAVVVILLEQT